MAELEETLASYCGALLQRSPLALAVLQGSEPLFVFVNEAFCRLVGREAATLWGRALVEALPEPLAQSSKDILSRAFDANATLDSVKLVHEDAAQGSVYWTISAWPLITSKGDVRWMVHVADSTEDVTARQGSDRLAADIREVNERLLLASLRERELLEAEERKGEELRALADNVAQLAWMADHAGVIYWQNRRWSEYTGVGIDAMLPDGWKKVVHPDHALRVEGSITACFLEGCAFEDIFPLRARDGTYRWFLSQVVPVLDDSKVVRRWVGTHTDVSAQREIEEALRASEERARRQLAEIETVYASSPIGLCVFDTNLHWMRLNQRFADMNGAPIDAHLGRTPRQVVPDLAEQFERAFARIMKDGEQLLDFEMNGATPAQRGVQRVWNERWLPIHDDGGSIIGISVAAEEITERKRAEEALRDADRRKDEFLAVLSHELRNPLAPIRSSLYILERSSPQSDDAKRVQAVIGRQVTHLSRLVDDLLDVTRISRGKVQLQVQPLELGGLVSRTVEDHRGMFEASGVKMELTLPPDPTWIQGDPTRLAQVVGNLLGNAAKFTSRGGRVFVSLQKEGHEAVLHVVDNGLGIPPEVLPGLFQPFTQAEQPLDRSRGGLGLGLALVKGLVQLHGGRVAVQSAGLGQGSDFSVRLELTEAAEPRGRADGSTADEKSRRVLVIEDNVDSAEMLKEALELMGHQVEVAFEGEQGLAVAQALEPDVVVCDIGLPKIDGYEVARRLRKLKGPGSPVLIALTGYALPEERRRATEAGFSHHLAKPPALEALDQLIRTSSRASR